VNDADKVQAAKRLLDDPLVAQLLAKIENTAVELMLDAEDDLGRREGRDTVKTVQAFRKGLEAIVAADKEAKRPRPGIA
jgi:hypothetical protein